MNARCVLQPPSPHEALVDMVPMIHILTDGLIHLFVDLGPASCRTPYSYRSAVPKGVIALRDTTAFERDMAGEDGNPEFTFGIRVPSRVFLFQV